MRHATWVLIAALALSLSLAVAGCGKKGPPEPPSVHKDPQQYPNPNE